MKFGLSNLLLAFLVLALVFGWWVDRSRMHTKIKAVDRSVRVASRSSLLAWHHSDASKINDRYRTIRTMILLFKEKENFDLAESAVELYPPELFAAELLQSIGVKKTEDYFKWANDEFDSKLYSMPEFGMNEYVMPGREIHDNQGFHDFVRQATKHIGETRLVIPFK